MQSICHTANRPGRNFEAALTKAFDSADYAVEGTRMTARVLRWLIFSILFSLLPFGFDYLMVLSRTQGGPAPGLPDVIGKGELCLVVVTLSLVGAGEIYGVQLKDERIGIALAGFSLINAVSGIALYVMMKSSAAVFPAFIYLSLLLIVTTIIVATCCISISEVKNV